MKTVTLDDGRAVDITPDASVASHRTGTLRRITTREIAEAFGFAPNVDDDPDKVRYSWGAVVDGAEIAVWDYKGSARYNEFSTFGPDRILSAMFGTAYETFPRR